AAAHADEAPRVGEAPHRLLGDRAPGARHQLVHVVARLGGLHLLGRVELREAHSITQTAWASSRDCGIESSTRPAPPRSAPPLVQPLSLTRGVGRPAISISRHVNRRPEPSALPTASLPAKRAA